MNRLAALLLAVVLLVIAGTQGLTPLTAQASSNAANAGQAREALEIARQQQRNARRRAEQLEAETERAQLASRKAQVEAAALAARVQQAEAGVAAAQAELAMVEQQRSALARDLAERQEPLARLTGALQTMARRPIALAVLQPGSLRDVVHTNAVLSGAVPVVRQRTAALRGDLERTRALAEERRSAVADQADAEARLQLRRRDMIALAEQERVKAEQAAGGASREAARALALAEQARDLDALVGSLEEMASRRTSLGGDGNAFSPEAASPSVRNAVLGTYLLPADGRVTKQFGESGATAARSTGIVLRPRAGAQVVSPGEGRIAFAGEYEGYGRIAIIEHEGGWTSLVTGLSSVSVVTGQNVAAGSPLGLASRTRPEIALELRRAGKPVDPLKFVR